VSLHPEVKAALKAWADAGELEASAKVLSAARRDLDAALLPQLRRKIAEISAECCVELLALERDVTPGEPIEVLGMQLMPKQAERFVAWAQDQQATGLALGVEPEAWSRMVETGMRTYVDKERAAAGTNKSSVKDWSRRAAEAQQLLDGVSRHGFNVEAPDPKRSGLMGLLAAKKFKS